MTPKTRALPPLWQCAAMTAALVAFAVARPALPSLTGPRHAARPYDSFESFWPLYISQHKEPACKLLHGVGTAHIAILSLATGGFERLLRLSLAIAAAGSVVLPLADVFAGLRTGAAEGAVMVVVLMLCARTFSNCSVRFLVAVLVSCYFFAWSSHFFIEHNRPATFLHPVFSLCGDFYMLGSLLIGRIQLNSTAASGL